MFASKINDIINRFHENEFSILVTNTVEDLNLFLVSEQFLQQKNTVFLVASNLYHAQRMYDVLENILDEKDVSLYPVDEFVTSELLAASTEFKSARLETMKRLVDGIPQIVVTHTAGLVRRLRPFKYWEGQIITLRVKDIITKLELLERLKSLGYHPEYQVERQGDYSARGYIIDLYLFEYPDPIRIEFFDDEIESIRTFDLDTMRSKESIQEIKIYPNSEVHYSSDESKMIVDLLNDSGLDEKKEKDIFRFTEVHEIDSLQKYIQYVSNDSIIGYASNPIVYLSNTKRIKDTYLTMIDDISEWYLSGKHYQNLKLDFVYDIHEVIGRTRRIVGFDQVLSSDLMFKTTVDAGAKEIVSYDGNLDLLKKDLNKETRTILFANQQGIRKLNEDFGWNGIFISSLEEVKQGCINIGGISDLLSFGTDEVLILSTKSIFKQQNKAPKKHFALKEAVKLKSKEELKAGDFIVHYDYGIGEYLGIKSMEIGGVTNDYIHIGYREEEMLYVPVENIHLLQKYVGSEGAKPRLNSIGGASWAKTKARVKKKLQDIAGKLIRLYAERQKTKGFSFLPDDEEQLKFEEDFPFTETFDQLRAIAEIKQDMESAQPMDRLICGDVGYGKTEVAMRAAFKAVHSLKQVAYLCPTTVLSKQHFKTFKERFSKYGIKIELLNRFVTQSAQSRILNQLAKGEIDVLIGTHRILSKDIEFYDLGLLIVDEEQRFGVEHKERIKELKVNVDVISLSATPIPRTLQMSLMGVKSTSLLETAPLNRYPIQTYVLEENMSVIKDAVEREMTRDGQVFILYNKVSNIQVMANKIQRLVPEAKVAFAHGQMHKVELDDTMNDFTDGIYNVLVCTTIIETGIDIPNANTLIILDADRLGLAQLYQIRGRVGRSDRIAYAFLMYKGRQLTEKAEKRLSVIKEFTELGSGFKIALRDLNIRGAGDVLGAEQSGFIDSVGFDLYMQMLEEEIQEQQGMLLKAPTVNTATNIKVSKYIPDDYAEQEELKIMIHRKIKELNSSIEAKALIEELGDTYGYVPEHLITFMYKTIFDKFAAKYEVDLIEDKTKTMLVRFGRETSSNMDGEKLLLAAFHASVELDLGYKNNRISMLLKSKNDKYIQTFVRAFEYYENGIPSKNNSQNP